LQTPLDQEVGVGLKKVEKFLNPQGEGVGVEHLLKMVKDAGEDGLDNPLMQEEAAGVKGVENLLSWGEEVVEGRAGEHKGERVGPYAKQVLLVAGGVALVLALLLPQGLMHVLSTICPSTPLMEGRAGEHVGL